MSSLKRSLLVLLGSVLVLLCLLGSILAWLGSASGTRWLLLQLPGTVAIAHSRGSLLETLELEGVVYQQGELRFDARRITLHWNPWALLHGDLHLKRVELLEPRVQLPATGASDSAPATEPPALPLPTLRLPLQLSLDQLRLLQPQLRLGEQSYPLDSLELQATLLLDRLRLQRLRLVHRYGQLQLSGSLQLSHDYLLALNSAWQLQLPEQPPLAGSGSIAGSLRALKLEQQLRQPFPLRLALEVDALDAEFPWRANVTLPRLRLADPTLSAWLARQGVDPTTLPALLQPLLAGSARLALQAQGHLGTLNGELQLSGEFPRWGTLRLDSAFVYGDQQLTLSRADLAVQSGEQLSLQGQLILAGDRSSAALSGRWRNFSWPLFTRDPDQRLLHSPAGSFQFSGTPTHYQLRLDGQLDAAPEWPAVSLSAQADGSDSGFRQLDLAVDSAYGGARYRGSVEWQQGLSWQGALTLHELNPAYWAADWPGQLSAELQFAGHSDDAALALSARQFNLTGVLQALPLQASAARLAWQADTLHLSDTQLAIAEHSRLSASGSVGADWDLRWQLSADNLAALLPKLLPQRPIALDGALSGSGQLSGPLRQPRISGQLDARQLHLPQGQLAALTSRFDLDLQPQRPASLSLHLSGLQLGDLAWQQLSFSLDGSLAQHRTRLSASGGPVAFDWHALGRWDPHGWHARHRQLTLSQAELGSWQLASAAPLAVDGERFELGQLCLAQAAARLCARAVGSYADGGTATATLNDLPLPATLLAQLPFALQAAASAETTLRWSADGAPRVDAQLALQQASIEVSPELWLPLQRVEAELSGDRERLRLKARLETSELAGHFDLNGSISRPLEDPRFDLRGKLDAHDLRLLALLLPELRNPSGTLQGQLRLRGSLAQPALAARVELSQGAFELPTTGIRVEQLQLTLRDDPSQSSALILTGSARSGEGSLNLDGRFNLVSRSASLTLAGSDFRAVALPEAEVWISPNLHLSLTPELLRLEGEVLIPKARLMPLDRSGRTQPSGDVVFIDEQAEANKRRPYQAEVRLRLGDDVQFKGFGFETRLLGELLLLDDDLRGSRAAGAIQVEAGHYRLYGQAISIDRGRFIFSGGPVENPGLDVRISRQVDEVVVGAQISGTLQESEFTLFSSPAMPDSELLTYLLLGRAPGSSEADEQTLALRAALAVGTSGGNKLGEKLSEKLPVDELGFSSEQADNTSFYIGKYLSPRVYVRYGVGLIEPTTTFFLRYKLSDKWHFETETGTYSSAADLIYTIEN